MSATMTNNDAPRTRRRQLTEELEKLDTMIDGLSEAIPGTIKDVLEQQVGTAIADGIKAAVLEVLANPDLITVFKHNMPPSTPPASQQGPVIVPIPRPSLLRTLLSKFKSTVAGVARWGQDKVVTAAKTIADTACLVKNKVAALSQRLWRYRLAPKEVVLALAVGGLAASAVALVATHSMGLTLSGVGGACHSAAAQLGLWLRQGSGRLGLVSN